MAGDIMSVPKWWDWELEFTPHLLKRMEDRGFNEVDLRSMLTDASGWRKSAAEGRYIITSRFHREDWEIVLEPEEEAQLLIVVTAYRRET